MRQLGQHCCARGIQVGAPVGGTTQKFLRGSGIGIEGVHLALEGFEFIHSQVTGAAQSRGCLDELSAGIELSRGKRLRTLIRQRRYQDIGGGMQIALVVAANQLAVPGESHIAFLDAGAHARARFMAFPGVLRELQRAPAPVTDRKGRLAERTLAAPLQPALERAGAHLVDQIKRTRPDLDGAVPVGVARVVVGVGKNR